MSETTSQRAVRFHLVDLFNLALGKGSNLILTTVLLFYASRTLSNAAFIEFVMWWSIAMMIGGVVLGGIGTAAIRSAAVDNRLIPVAVVGVLQRYGVVIGFVGVIVLALLTSLGFHKVVLAAILGMVLQSYNSTVVVARSIKEYVQSLVTSGICLAVAITGHIAAWLLGLSGQALQFGIMIAAFACAALYGAATLLPLLKVRRQPSMPVQMSTVDFWKVAIAFSIGNALVASLMNIDYGLMKRIGLEGPIASEAGAKVYFERFVLPFWLLIANTAALEILRSPQTIDDMRSTRFTIGLSRIRLFLFLVQFVVAVAGYYVYRIAFNITVPSPPLATLVIIALAYVGYAIIGLVLDIYLLTTPPREAIVQSAVVIGCYALVSWFALTHFGGAGWAVAWFGVNALLVWFTSRRNVAYQPID
jgi:hypothetical protein